VDWWWFPLKVLVFVLCTCSSQSWSWTHLRLLPPTFTALLSICCTYLYNLHCGSIEYLLWTKVWFSLRFCGHTCIMISTLDGVFVYLCVSSLRCKMYSISYNVTLEFNYTTSNDSNKEKERTVHWGNQDWGWRVSLIVSPINIYYFTLLLGTL